MFLEANDEFRSVDLKFTFSNESSKISDFVDGFFCKTDFAEKSFLINHYKVDLI